jgi:hypothetical protein
MTSNGQQKWAWVFGSRPPPSREKIIVLALLFGIAVVAFFSNPNQATHLTAIKEVVKLRTADEAAAVNKVLMPHVHYNNYFFFSSTTIRNGETTLTWGCFGQVQTTDGIEILFGPSKNE